MNDDTMQVEPIEEGEILPTQSTDGLELRTLENVMEENYFT